MRAIVSAILAALPVMPARAQESSKAIAARVEVHTMPARAAQVAVKDFLRATFRME